MSSCLRTYGLDGGRATCVPDGEGAQACTTGSECERCPHTCRGGAAEARACDGEQLLARLELDQCALHRQTRSSTVPVPSPPPQHMVTSAYRPSVRSSSC